MNWQRARTEENKNERKEAIHQAALKLFKEEGYEGVSFNAIASEAGFTKSNMYRYFSSREEIFLNVFAELFQDWFDDYHARLEALRKNTSPEKFAQAWLDSLNSREKFLDLTPLLFLALEKNSSYEQLVVFKRLSMNLLFQLSQQIERIYPQLQGEKAFSLLTLSYNSMSNYWAANQQSDALRKLYAEEEFQMLKPNFERDLSIAIQTAVKGLIAD